jgi:hypothetical protein
VNPSSTINQGASTTQSSSGNTDSTSTSK